MVTRRRVPVLGLAALLLGAAPLGSQSLELVPERTRATIGDPIRFKVTVRLRPGMALIDLYPRSLVPPPRGIRVLSSDTLRPVGNDVYEGQARVAFYRLGPQPVPTLGLIFRPDPDEPPDTLVHLPVSIEITPTLAAGNPELRDIKPLQPLGGPVWMQIVGILAGVAAAFGWLWRRGRRHAEPPAPLTPLAGPFEAALARLAALEAESRASGNGILPLYTGVSDLVRDCLRQVGALPNAGLTTPEVGERLPRWLADGPQRRQCELILTEADLVKFARVRPDFRTASDHVTRTRQLLEGWRDRTAPIPAPAEPPSPRTAE